MASALASISLVRSGLPNQVIELGDEATLDLGALRRHSIGFVFQAPYLSPFLDVTGNVTLLPMLAGHLNREARAVHRAADCAGGSALRAGPAVRVAGR